MNSTLFNMVDFFIASGQHSRWLVDDTKYYVKEHHQKLCKWTYAE